MKKNQGEWGEFYAECPNKDCPYLKSQGRPRAWHLRKPLEKRSQPLCCEFCRTKISPDRVQYSIQSVFKKYNVASITDWLIKIEERLSKLEAKP